MECNFGVLAADQIGADVAVLTVGSEARGGAGELSELVFFRGS